MSIKRWLPLAGIVAITGLVGCGPITDVCSTNASPAVQLTGLENDNDETDTDFGGTIGDPDQSPDEEGGVGVPLPEVVNQPQELEDQSSCQLGSRYEAEQY